MESALQSHFARLHIRLKQVTHKSLTHYLYPGEVAWMKFNGCDCNLLIGENLMEPETFDPVADARKRYARKGWNASKINRALADMQQKQMIPRGRMFSLADIITGCIESKAVPYIRVFYHNYSGLISDEILKLQWDASTSTVNLDQVLDNLAEDHILKIQP